MSNNDRLIDTTPWFCQRPSLLISEEGATFWCDIFTLPSSVTGAIWMWEWTCFFLALVISTCAKLDLKAKWLTGRGTDIPQTKAFQYSHLVQTLSSASGRSAFLGALYNVPWRHPRVESNVMSHAGSTRGNVLLQSFKSRRIWTYMTATNMCWPCIHHESNYCFNPRGPVSLQRTGVE